MREGSALPSPRPSSSVREANLPKTVALLLAFTLALPAVSLAAGIPQPEGYRLSDYRSPTPDGVTGATTVDTQAVQSLLSQGRVIPIFVQRLERSTLPGGPWLQSKPYRQIPGSVWLPNVGVGAPDAATLVHLKVRGTEVVAALELRDLRY